MRLPTRVTLPFGYIVKVKAITDSEMAEEMDAESSEDICDGLWESETRTIFIRKSLPTRRQRYVLGHELLHAVLDFTHDTLNSEIAKP